MHRNQSALVASAVLAAALLAGCQTPPDGQKETAGTVIGAVVGGIVGHQIGGGAGRDVATVIGAIAGGAVGNRIGRTMDDNDRIRTAQVLETGRTGAPVYWRNPDNGYEYTVAPTRTYDAAQGPCREYTVDSVIGGERQKVYGTACRQPDGSWRAQN